MNSRWTRLVTLSSLCFAAAAAYACNPKSGQDPDAAQPPVPTTDVTAPSATATASDAPAPSAEPSAEPIPDDAGGPAPGFTQCPPKTPDAGPTMCTKEYRPVCGLVDTGVRCITTPCPSATKRTFGNKCTACAAEKVIGYTDGACPEDAKK